MDYISLILQAAAVFTALSVIVAAAIKTVKTVNKFVSNFNAFITDVNELKEHSSENYMALLRLTIMSSEMPIGERIVAGHKYLEKGGNGDVKKFLKENFNITDTVKDAPHYKE